MSSTIPPPPIPETISYVRPPQITGGPQRIYIGYGRGKSHEAEVIAARFEEVVTHFSSPYTRLVQDLAIRFKTCHREWKASVKYLSDINEICTDFAYLRIIGMGTLALPYIFKELRREPDHWFWALKAITNADPVPKEHRGRMRLMTEDWLRWAEQNGFA